MKLMHIGLAAFLALAACSKKNDSDTESSNDTTNDSATTQETAFSCYNCACSPSSGACINECDQPGAGNFCTDGETTSQACEDCVATYCEAATLQACNY